MEYLILAIGRKIGWGYKLDVLPLKKIDND